MLVYGPIHHQDLIGLRIDSKTDDFIGFTGLIVSIGAVHKFRQFKGAHNRPNNSDSLITFVP